MNLLKRQINGVIWFLSQKFTPGNVICFEIIEN